MFYTTTTLANRSSPSMTIIIIIIIIITAWHACETYATAGKRRRRDVSTLLRSLSSPSANFPKFPSAHRGENRGKTTADGVVEMYGAPVLDEIDFGSFRKSLSYNIHKIVITILRKFPKRSLILIYGLHCA